MTIGGWGLVLVFALGTAPANDKGKKPPAGTSQQKQNLNQLKADLQAIYKKSAVTTGQKQTVVNDLKKILSGASMPSEQSVQALANDLSKALADGTLTPTEAVKQFLDQGLPMLILADVGTVAGETHDRLARWIDDGGVLVRFAGPRLAASEDDLVPVKLRRGGRVLGGALSWDQPQALSGFSRDGAFATMPMANTNDALDEISYALDRLKSAGARRLALVCLVVAPEGLEAMEEHHPDVPIWTAAVDRQLDDNAYIRPGLGDAGDRVFGTE